MEIERRKESTNEAEYREQRERHSHCHVEGKAVKVTKGARHFKTVIKLSPGCILRLPLCVGGEGHRKATLCLVAIDLFPSLGP